MKELFFSTEAFMSLSFLSHVSLKFLSRLSHISVRSVTNGISKDERVFRRRNKIREGRRSPVELVSSHTQVRISEKQQVPLQQRLLK